MVQTRVAGSKIVERYLDPDTVESTEDRLRRRQIGDEGVLGDFNLKPRRREVRL